MVVNLCLPHFQTTAHCNKLCADGYDVSNLLSGDPAARRRGFKLEYFLRPPLHVTLHFQTRVELCRVDIELWPCGMDQGSITRRLEIFTCSDLVSKISECAQETGQFKLVGRCDLREEVLVCFKHSNFRHRAPFLEPPPEPSAQVKQHELWSRGLQSLRSVAQLRVSLPYGGAASALGIKSLAVWGIPAHCCPPLELEKFQEAHFQSLKPKPPSFSLVSPVTTSPSLPRPNPSSSKTPIPEEFLDPLTQELMVLPMILPSGMVVDSSTLEEYQKQEAAWGRLPNDPFTGVPFTQDSKPLPNPLLKSRIDSLMLQTGCTRVGSRNGLLNKPQPSKLTSLSCTKRPSGSADLVSVQSSLAGPNETDIQQVQSAGFDITEELQKDTISSNKSHSKVTESRVQSESCVERQTFIVKSVTESYSIGTENLRHCTKRKYQSDLSANTDWTSTYSSPLSKCPKQMQASSSPQVNSSQSSHEQRLSDSLDQALNSALHGLPRYTSQSKPEPETTPGQSQCGSCFCSLTVYSTSQPAYALPCSHLLCRSCLQREHPPSSQRLSITCPTCKASASPSTITRVHH
ncbi:RING finger protein 37 [Colossoma macropomum]|uniref:RING finger protein 37 n=1 Tax=Colossoma macropomum TaxID=42526 RepID=UPI0018651F9E|nr:RING finger protein 37 [Colossoma macropomum]